MSNQQTMENLNNPIMFTEEEANLAGTQEESERLASENYYLKQRVTVLRALVNRLQKEAQEKALLTESVPDDTASDEPIQN